jgi:hypothetical protein
MSLPDGLPTAPMQAAGSVRARLALVERYATLRGVPYLLDEAMAHARAALPSLLAELDESGGAGVRPNTYLTA